MKNKLFTLAIAAIVGLAAFTQTAEARVTQADRFQFNALRQVLASLPVGSPRLTSIARQMARLNPVAAVQTIAAATQKASSATQLNQVLTAVLTQVGFAPATTLTTQQQERLLVDVSIGAREIAPTNPRILASVEGNTQELNRVVTVAAVQTINVLVQDENSRVTTVEGTQAITEIAGSAGAGVPYGA